MGFLKTMYLYKKHKFLRMSNGNEDNPRRTLYTSIASGRKKCSKAQVMFLPKKDTGKSTIFINNRLAISYLQSNPSYTHALTVPLIKAGIDNLHDIHILTEGGE